MNDDINISNELMKIAEIKEIGDLPPETEIGEIILADTLPQNLTYPDIQPHLFKRASQMQKHKGGKKIHLI